MEGIIKAICISKQKGTEKHPVQDIEIIEDHGLERMRMQVNGIAKFLYCPMKSVKNLRLKVPM